MVIYSKQNILFESKHHQAPQENQQILLPRPIYNFIRITLPEIFKAFFISSLILLNIGLIVIAGLWFLLVFSVFTPIELVEMYSVQPSLTAATTQDDYTLVNINVPAPPPLIPDAYGGLNRTQQVTSQR